MTVRSSEMQAGRGATPKSNTSNRRHEMLELFQDAPELLANTLEIAKRCSLEIRLGASMLPAYPVPAGSSTEDFLREESRRGLAEPPRGRAGVARTAGVARGL